jgi:hypothetical protein
MSGAPRPNRIVTFLEINFSPNWAPTELPNPYDGFVEWSMTYTEVEPVGSISITRTDGKVLSFTVTGNPGIVLIRENVIRWSSNEDIPGSDGPFQ